MSVSAVVESLAKDIILVAARFIANKLTSGESQAQAWDRVADLAKLRASAQRALDKRRAKR